MARKRTGNKYSSSYLKDKEILVPNMDFIKDEMKKGNLKFEHFDPLKIKISFPKGYKILDLYVGMFIWIEGQNKQVRPKDVMDFFGLTEEATMQIYKRLMTYWFDMEDEIICVKGTNILCGISGWDGDLSFNVPQIEFDGFIQKEVEKENKDAKHREIQR